MRICFDDVPLHRVYFKEILTTNRMFLKSIIDHRRQLQMDMFFWFSLFLPLSFLTQILLIKLWEPAGFSPPSPPPFLLISTTFSQWEQTERETQREKRERETEQRVDSWRLCSGSYQYLGSVNEARQRSHSIPNTPPKLSLNPHRVSTHTRRHLLHMYTVWCHFLLSNVGKK